MKIIVNIKEPSSMNHIRGFLDELEKKYAPMKPIVKSMELDVAFRERISGDLLDMRDNENNPIVVHVDLVPVHVDNCDVDTIASVFIKVSTTKAVLLDDFIRDMTLELDKCEWLKWNELSIGHNTYGEFDLEPYDSTNLNRHHMFVKDIVTTEPGFYMPFTLRVCFSEQKKFIDLCDFVGSVGRNIPYCQAIKIEKVKMLS